MWHVLEIKCFDFDPTSWGIWKSLVSLWGKMPYLLPRILFWRSWKVLGYWVWSSLLPRNNNMTFFKFTLKQHMIRTASCCFLTTGIPLWPWKQKSYCKLWPGLFPPASAIFPPAIYQWESCVMDMTRRLEIIHTEMLQLCIIKVMHACRWARIQMNAKHSSSNHQCIISEQAR